MLDGKGHAPFQDFPDFAVCKRGRIRIGAFSICSPNVPREVRISCANAHRNVCKEFVGEAVQSVGGEVGEAQVCAKQADTAIDVVADSTG